MKISFNRMELAGSLGDLGTLLPLAFGMIVICGLSATGIFLSVGLLYILGGFYFRLPIAVQPMKVVSAYAIAQALSQDVITASGLLLAGFLLFLGLTGLTDFVARIIAKCVIRGVQMATGVLLFSKGLQLMVGRSDFQAVKGLIEPFLSIQKIGPLPISILIGVGFSILALALLNSRKVPAGLAVVVLGAVVGLFCGAWQELTVMHFGLYFPDVLPFGLPTGADFSFALVALVLPQIPMSMGNAVIANRDLSFEYFGADSRHVTDRALCISMGLANIVAALFGGMPICHGAGGLAAHYRFGARTHGSNLIIGGLFVFLAVFFGPGAANALHLLPMGVLGVLLLFAGTQLCLTVQDVMKRSDLFVVVVMLGIALTVNLAWAFCVGILVELFLRKARIRV